MLLLLILIIIVVGCAQYGVQTEDKTIDGPINDVDRVNKPTSEIISPAINDKFPTISTRVSPSNPNLGDSIELTIDSMDDYGINHLSFESAKAFVGSSVSDVFDCNLQKACANSWKLTPAEEGIYEILIEAVDSSGQSGTHQVKVDVRPARKIESMCGNGFCNSKETEESCPQDCYKAPLFACANGICEGGESYESCPQDCGLSDIIGTTRGDGACEPGEDAQSSPQDCTEIKPNCGNNICDPDETTTSCSADCEEKVEDDSCNSNAECGYRKACIGGKCVSVDCTTDAHCTGCRRCSSYRCVRCGYGASGYCTC